MSFFTMGVLGLVVLLALGGLAAISVAVAVAINRRNEARRGHGG